MPFYLNYFLLKLLALFTVPLIYMNTENMPKLFILPELFCSP